MAKYFITLSLSIICFSVNAGDPTRPLIPSQSTVKSTPNSKPKTKQPLKAIFSRGNKRYAIIEDKVYYRGDRYRGSRIIAIQSDKVILQTSKGKQYLTLIKNVKKKN